MENYLTLLVKDASGNGVEDPLFLKMTGFRKTTIYPAGLFADAQFILPRDILTRPSMLSAGYEVTIVSGGMVVYHGWVDGLDDVSNTSAEGTRVSCVGDWAKYMERRGLERRWADTDITERWWKVNTAASGAELATVDRRDRIRMTPKAEAWSNSDAFQLDYQTPTGELIGKITLDYELAEGAQAWELALFNGLADEFSITSSSTGSQNVDLGTAAAQLRLIANAGQTPTSDGTYFAEVSNMVVFAARDSASASLGSMNVYEMALDFIDLLGVDETSISADTSDLSSALNLSLIPFVSNGYEMLGSQMSRAAGFGDSSQNAIGYGLRPPNYAPDNLPRLFVETYPALTDYDYQASSDEVGLSVRLNLDDVWNWIAVEFTDENNEPQRVTPDDNSALKDTTSISAYGQRETVLKIGNSDTGTATAYGQRYLARHKQPTYAVTKPLRVARLRAKNGGWVPAIYINAGKRIRFDDLPNRIAQASPTGTTFIITRADYDHESGIATLSIGGVPDDLAILLTQMQAGY